MNPSYPDIKDSLFWNLHTAWSGESLVSIERFYNIYQSLMYIERAAIPGAIVECGVYKGGTVAFGASLLLTTGRTDREFYLFDTFEGFPEDAVDMSFQGEKLTRSAWVTENFRQVTERNVSRSMYPRDKFHFVAGPVEETLPQHAPDQIALLHLDTDYYRSTKHELTHLFPHLVSGGVLIIDDYGHFQGARRAVDEFINENKLPLLLHRVDYTARIAIKP